MLNSRQEMQGVTDEEFNHILKARAILTKYAAGQKKFFYEADIAFDFFRIHLGNLPREHFMVAFLRNDFSLISADTMFIGTMSSVTVDHVSIVKRALELNSNAIILAHNHPSGDCTPSQDDVDLTYRIDEALKIFNISLFDHIIVGDSVLSMVNSKYIE